MQDSSRAGKMPANAFNPTREEVEATDEELVVDESFAAKLGEFYEYIYAQYISGYGGPGYVSEVSEPGSDTADRVRILLSVILIAVERLRPRESVAVSCARDDTYEDSHPENWFYIVRRPDRDGLTRVRVKNPHWVEAFHVEFEGDRLVILEDSDVRLRQRQSEGPSDPR